MSDPAAVVVGPCYACDNLFGFDPSRVPSIPIDPVTGLPPDLGGDAQRAVRRPICPSCVKDRINPERRERGLELFSEEDTGANTRRIAQELLGE